MGRTKDAMRYFGSGVSMGFVNLKNKKVQVHISTRVSPVEEVVVSNNDVIIPSKWVRIGKIALIAATSVVIASLVWKYIIN